MQLLIECTTEEQDALLHDFCIFTCERLEIGNPPSFTFVEHTGVTSFGSYTPSEEAIIVATEGRHTSDILRTLGHELVHHKQLSEGDNEMTLEELEYEANAVAGMLMRDYNKLHPEMFGLAEPIEPGPGTIGDSQGAAFPDPTRPSGPIEFAEEMTAGAGDVAGIGIGPQGEPGVTPKKKKTLKMFRRKLMNPVSSFRSNIFDHDRPGHRRKLLEYNTIIKDTIIEARKKLTSGKYPR